MRFGEFFVFVGEVIGGGEVMEFCLGFVCFDFGGGKDDVVVDNVVFVYELVELYVVWVVLLFFLLVGVIGCD